MWALGISHPSFGPACGFFPHCAAEITHGHVDGGGFMRVTTNSHFLVELDTNVSLYG